MVDRNFTDVLVDIALKNLPKMLICEKHLFGWEVAKSDLTPKFDNNLSLRYSIMVLLGIARAKCSGYDITINIENIHKELLKNTNTMTIGDLGLFLWLNKRLMSNNNTEILSSIRNRLASTNWHQIISMELAWLILGLTIHSSNNKGEGHELVDLLVQYVLDNRSAPSGLFYHTGKGIRRRFPNFATQIYLIHALSIRARLVSDEVCCNRAIQAAERLSQLQNSNGGWPWLYDADRGIVVEPFEIYSVHQDAMAPMAFNELFLATGFDMTEKIYKGLSWLDKGNELQFNMLDTNNGLIYRSIRRKKPLNRLCLYSAVIRSTIGVGIGHAASPQYLEVNLTCRPYHLGWILEAWCDGDM